MTSARPDLVLINAKIRTMESTRPWAEGLAVRRGRFVAVGDRTEIASLVGAGTEVVDCAGRLVLPGLMDGHCHAYEGARAALYEVRLSPGDELPDLIGKAGEAALRLPDGDWLKGAGWSGRLVGQMRLREALVALDAATGNRPAALRDSSHHTMFANSAAMQRAGISRDTADVVNGSVDRRPDGSLSGLFFEEACALIDRAIPSDDILRQRETVLHAARTYNGYGVTGLVHAVTSENVMATFSKLDKQGELSLWVATCIATDSILTPERDGIGAQTIANRHRYATAHVTVDFVKYFMDGVPAGRTASFLEPYLPDASGAIQATPPFHDSQALRNLILPLDAAGIHVKVHAVGDRSIRETLDAIEGVRSINGASGPRHSIAHLSYVTDEDIPRLARLNVVADLCPPLWFPNDIIRSNATLLGRERGDRAWPTGDIVRSGALAVLGTDWPIVPTPNPWPGVSSLITRKDPHGASAGAFRPEQAMTVDQALALCTSNVAECMGLGSQTGSIAVGKAADFIIVNHNLFEVDPEAIAETVVQKTYFAGRLVHCV